jgi:hypothetical protein
MFSDKTLGRGAAAGGLLAVSASAISASPWEVQKSRGVIQEKLFEKQAAIHGLFALGLVLYRLSVECQELAGVGVAFARRCIVAALARRK